MTLIYDINKNLKFVIFFFPTSLFNNMQEQLIEYVTESKTYSKYSQDDEQHIAELCEMYYIKTNTRSNVLSPQRVQINKRCFKNTTEEYNIRQRALPDGCERSEKALY